MANVSYTLTSTEEGGAVITVYVSGKGSFVAQDTHPNFQAIVQGAIAQDENVGDLFDLSLTAGTYLEALTERVSVAHGRVYFDGEEVDNSLTQQIVRFLESGEEDWHPLVNFYEKVMQNPEEHSREQLYTWLANKDFTITRDGNIVGYKGVVSYDGEGFDYQSISEGTAIVDGEVFTGKIPQRIGSVVEMPRNQVVHDPGESCSVGLHVATYEYAESWASGAMLEVHVNPRDVVSVPTESSMAKVRVCRYQVVNTIDAPHTLPVVDDYRYEEEGEEYCWECGEEFEDCLCDQYGYDSEFDQDNPLDLSTLKYTQPVSLYWEAGESSDSVAVGDVFQSTDKRRTATFTVEALVDGHAYGQSDNGEKTRARKIKLDRLTSRKYQKV